MEICIFTEPHRGADYETQRVFARHVERLGFAGLFRADHYQRFGAGDPRPGPTDAWLTLAALARDTDRIRLGTLVTSMTFRLPGPLAIMVAQVDQMSGGRVELGIGAGWYEREHRSYGIPFPPLGERMEQLAEQVEVIGGLWRTPPGETFSYHGRHYRLVDSPALPKPVQRPGPPVIVGGRGLRRTPRLAARCATEFNAAFLSPAEAADRFRVVTDACDRYDRSPDLPRLRLSGGVHVACGRTDAEARARAAGMHDPNSALPQGEQPVIGGPEQLVDRIGALGEAGADRAYLRLSDLTDLDHLDLLAAEVLPKVAS